MTDEMFQVTFGMRFHKRQLYLCANKKGERFLGPRSEAVRFASREEAQEAADSASHRDIVQRAVIRS